MPKTRGSGTIAAGGGSAPQNGGTERTGVGGSSSDNSVIDIAQRVIDRLQEARDVIIPMYSASRGRMEDTQVSFDPNTPGMATVTSNGGSYQVDYTNDDCDCMDHRIRRRRCRHIDAAHHAIGEVSRGVPAAGPLHIEEAVATQAEADMEAEVGRDQIQIVHEDDGFFYSDNEEEFQRALAAARETPLVMEYENVLNGSQNTFGLEIEFVGGNADAIARELYHLGICGYDRRVHYHSPSVAGKWRLESDGSVSSGSGGGELVSPVLTDTPETWRTLAKICEVATRHGAQIDHRTGGHIHCGMAPLDTARQRWKRFFRTIGGYEDIIYRLAGGSMGRIRSGHTHYATPFAERAAQNARARLEMNDERDIDHMARNVSGGNRYLGINLTNIYQPNKPNTVEFRYFNSSLDPAQIQANVKIANGILLASEKARIRDYPEDGIITGEHMKRRGEILRSQPLGQIDRSTHNGIKKLIDVIFTRKKDKDCALSVYAKNAWRN